MRVGQQRAHLLDRNEVMVLGCCPGAGDPDPHVPVQRRRAEQLPARKGLAGGPRGARFGDELQAVADGARDRTPHRNLAEETLVLRIILDGVGNDRGNARWRNSSA